MARDLGHLDHLLRVARQMDLFHNSRQDLQRPFSHLRYRNVENLCGVEGPRCVAGPCPSARGCGRIRRRLPHETIGTYVSGCTLGPAVVQGFGQVHAHGHPVVSQPRPPDFVLSCVTAPLRVQRTSSPAWDPHTFVRKCATVWWKRLVVSDAVGVRVTVHNMHTVHEALLLNTNFCEAGVPERVGPDREHASHFQCLGVGCSWNSPKRTT